MTLLYVTADAIGQPNHGGGSVTWNESEALALMGPCQVWGRSEIQPALVNNEDPWCWDATTASVIVRVLRDLSVEKKYVTQKGLVHFYSGTWSRTISLLKGLGIRTSITAAAHDVEKSRREHELLGLPYGYDHLNDPALWKRYLQGYLDADLVICPSNHSADVMRRFGCERVKVIPHGVDLPPADKIKPFPKQFVYGYMGAYGPDKGVRYLLEAWKRLALPDAVLLLAGRDSISPWVGYLIERFGGGNIRCVGWVPDVADFYGSLSLYVQPSITEGFGLEVLEAASFGRPVICSDGAGAADVLPSGAWAFPAGDVSALVERIQMVKWGQESNWNLEMEQKNWREIAAEFTWDKVRAQYVAVWKELLE